MPENVTTKSGSCDNSQWSEHVMGDRLLSVDADLVIGIGDQQMLMRGRGKKIVIELPSVSMAVKMVRDLGSFRSARFRLVAISSALTRVGLTVVVRTRGRQLMTIGHQGNSWLLRLFGVPHTRIHVF